jgi:membrane carboxypeptidase/penicillin-binding protein
VHLLDGGIENKPEASLDRLCGLALEAQIYRDCVRYYPFVLGAQPVRPIDLAAFYAAIANEGTRPVPYVVESIEHEGQSIYRHEQATVPINSVDRAAFYQLKTMLQGVLARGTARSIAGLAPYVAGKTGTSDEENDAWFVGFTNDVTVAVWIGYDNADGKRRTLGRGSTGGHTAVPIFEPVIQAVWANIASKTALAPPSPEARRQLACKSIDLESGERQSSGGKAFIDCFRIDQRGKVIDTQNRLIVRESPDAWRDLQGGATIGRRNKPAFPDEPRRESKGAYVSDTDGRPVSAPHRDPWRVEPYARECRREEYRREWQTPQRIDPSYVWGSCH